MIFKGYILNIKLDYIHSLKEKRSIIKPVLSEIRKKFNVSCIECGHQNSLDYFDIGLSMASLSNKDLENTLGKIINLIEIDHNLIIYTIEEL